MTLATEQTKQIDVQWSTGNDDGGFPSSLQGVGVIANTWYHVHLFTVGSTVEVGFDSSITAANLIADHGGAAGKYRRIGSVLTDGTTPGNIIAFTQVGDRFIWTVPVEDYNADPGTSETTTALTVPTGVSVNAEFTIRISGTGGTHIYHPNVTGVATNASFKREGAGEAGSTTLTVSTNTSAQVQHISDASLNAVVLVTLGWYDNRGRDD